MSLAIYQIDAFTDRPFAGNPAAVCVLGGQAVTVLHGALVAGV
jgi:predicted PhzF superfamily epimerase YddE/YHI9